MAEGIKKRGHPCKVAAALMAGALAVVLSMGLCVPAYAYEQQERIVNNGHGYISPNYLVVHETANPGASARNHVSLYSRGYAYAVQYVMELDGSVVYHTMNDNRKAWAVGNGNAQCVNIELAHATNGSDAAKQWNEAVKWCGDYLHSRGWGIDHMISHNEARLKWGGTDHTDPNSYFAKYGRSWDQFRAAVATYMNSGNVRDYSTNTTVEAAPQQSASGKDSASFGGTYTVMASKLNIRTAPSVSAGVVGSYARGAHVELDGWYKIADGYVWGRYTARSGSIRYVAVGKPTGGVAADDFLVKGGEAKASTPARGAGTYRFNTTVKVRTGAGTGYSAVGTYKAGSTVRIDSVVSAGGYDWGRYVAYSGKVRYVALGVTGGKAYAA